MAEEKTHGKDKVREGGDTPGEGNYSASRRFDEKQQKFVEEHRTEIPQKGKAAREALDGREGEQLKRAEEEAKRHAKD